MALMASSILLLTPDGSIYNVLLMECWQYQARRVNGAVHPLGGVVKGAIF